MALSGLEGTAPVKTDDDLSRRPNRELSTRLLFVGAVTCLVVGVGLLVFSVGTYSPPVTEEELKRVSIEGIAAVERAYRILAYMVIPLLALGLLMLSTLLFFHLHGLRRGETTK